MGAPAPDRRGRKWRVQYQPAGRRALAVAVFGALLASWATFMHGLRVSLLIAAAVALAAAAVSLLSKPHEDAMTNEGSSTR